MNNKLKPLKNDITYKQKSPIGETKKDFGDSVETIIQKDDYGNNLQEKKFIFKTRYRQNSFLF